MKNETLFSLNQLAKEFNVNKSKLSYYVSIKLIKPTIIIGKMMLFEKTKTINTIKKIETMQKNGLALKEIKRKLK